MIETLPGTMPYCASSSARCSPERTAIALRNQTVAKWRPQLIQHFEGMDTEQAATRADALMMVVLGLVFTAQIVHHDAFRTVARSSEFLAHAAALARIAVPLPASRE